VAVYAAVKEAVERARTGGGPTLVECETYRIGAHSSSDDPTRYRDEREVEQWKKRDPLDLLRGRLNAWGLWTARDEDELRGKCLEEVNAAIAEAEKKPDPPRESLFDDVYANAPWSLREQREEMLAAPAVPRPDAKNIAG
jgi:pyruvate dehydrogenase E1 component alpha subunit/2-oxoisovalerate dehydrogenase E1 component alpha subunit